MRCASRTSRSTVSRGRPRAQYASNERNRCSSSRSTRAGSSSSSKRSGSSRFIGQNLAGLRNARARGGRGRVGDGDEGGALLVGGEPEEPVPPEELFERLQPFNELVAEDSRGRAARRRGLTAVRRTASASGSRRGTRTTS